MCVFFFFIVLSRYVSEKNPIDCIYIIQPLYRIVGLRDLKVKREINQFYSFSRINIFTYGDELSTGGKKKQYFKQTQEIVCL